MNIFRRIWQWLRGLFRKRKKYKLIIDDPLIIGLDDGAWQVVTTRYSSWCANAGRIPVAFITFTRLDCVRDGNEYRCAAIKTREAYGDGKLEVEARFKGGKGTWPAIWMNHPDGSRDNFATYYEVDLSEYYETRDNTDTSYHFPASMRKEENFRHTATPVIKDGWNKFECSWDDEAIVVRINGKVVMRIDNDGDRDHYPTRAEDRTFQVILSMQAGNDYLQEVELDELPLWMDVRNFKLYKLTDNGSERV